MDKFMASISAVPPRPQDILQEAGPWGGLEEELHKKEWSDAGVAAGAKTRLHLLRGSRSFAKTGSGQTQKES
eukprot:COSAG06_NODE_4333_length_4359_cov_33.125393_5_plen_72_part_00